MSFTQRMRDIDLISSSLEGMSTHRKKLWKKTLEDCKELFRKKGLSQEVNAKAFDAISSLREKGTAGTHSPAALSIFRYVGEGLIRSSLSMAYEDKLPFDWSCHWSAAALQEVMIRLSALIAPMSLQRRSRILPFFPVSVLASAMDLITHSGADNLSWWTQAENIKTFIKKAKNMAKGFSGVTVSVEDKSLITNASSLFAEGLCIIAFLTGAKDFPSLANAAVESMETILLKRIRGARNPDVIPPMVFKKEKVLEIWNLLSFVAPIMGVELDSWIDFQHVHLSTREHSHITNICRNAVAKNGDNVCPVQLLSMDHLCLDLAYLYSDIQKTIDLISSKKNRTHVGQLMTVLAEPWEDIEICHHRKLFMLSIALMEGVDITTIDNSLMVQAIMEKLDDEGNFSSARKKRTKLNTRQSKRAPKLQPRVIYARPLSDSEEEYTSRHHHKRGRNRRKGANLVQDSDSDDSGIEGGSPQRTQPQPTRQTISQPRTTPQSRDATAASCSTPLERTPLPSNEPALSPPRSPAVGSHSISTHPKTTQASHELTESTPPIPDLSEIEPQNGADTNFRSSLTRKGQNRRIAKKTQSERTTEKTRSEESDSSGQNEEVPNFMRDCGLDSSLQDSESPMKNSPVRKKVRFINRGTSSTNPEDTENITGSPVNIARGRQNAVEKTDETVSERRTRHAGTNRNDASNERNTTETDDTAPSQSFARPKELRRSTRKRRRTNK